jgi:N utilization substance protein B
MSNSRTLARRCATQALYQWQMSGSHLADIEAQFLESLALTRDLFRRFRAKQALSEAERDRLEELLEKYCRSRPDDEEAPEPASLEDWAAQCRPPDIHEDYFKELLHEVPARLDAIDAALGEFSDRGVSELDPVERAILRIGGYELLFKPELPYRVAVNEAINLAKQFGASQSHRFVNGLLDKLARKHRAAEFGRRIDR